MTTRNSSDDPTRPMRRALEGIIGVPATEGNQIDVLRNGDEIFPAMFDAIDRATSTIDFLTFVYWQGEIGTEFAHRLGDKAAAGVRVRVLLDGLGARPIDHDLVELMEDRGVLVRWFRPLARLHPTEVNHRTHRKVLIVDEAVGFTGGVGIADEWKGDARDATQWRDTHFRVRGPAVDGLRAAFLDNWCETDPVIFAEGTDRFPDQPQTGNSIVQCVRSASETGRGDVDMVFRALVQLAQERLRITTAYFVPDDDLMDRLCEASERGVEIEILLPGPHADKRFVQLASERLYQRLLDSGIAIWNFQPSMLHAKCMTVDGLVANIGSANFNARSVAWDEEVNLVVFDPALAAVLDGHFEEDLTRSARIDLDRWDDRSMIQRTAERVVAPVKNLF